MTLDAIANKLVTTLGDRETEQNWEKIDGLLKELATRIASEGGKLDELLACVRKSREVIASSVSRHQSLSLSLDCSAFITSYPQNVLDWS